jgi:hypothetical protein
MYRSTNPRFKPFLRRKDHTFKTDLNTGRNLNDLGNKKACISAPEPFPIPFQTSPKMGLLSDSPSLLPEAKHGEKSSPKKYFLLKMCHTFPGGLYETFVFQNCGA